MLFTRFFAAALALVPAIQVLAAPASVNSGLSIREPPRSPVQEAMSLEGIIASTRADVGAIKSRLNPGDPQSVKTATVELKATFDGFLGNIKALKKAKTDGQNLDLAENGIFDSRSWAIIGQVYQLIKDILKLADQIRAIASAPNIGDVLKGVVEILKTIVKAIPTVISIIMSILPYL